MSDLRQMSVRELVCDATRLTVATRENVIAELEARCRPPVADGTDVVQELYRGYVAACGDHVSKGTFISTLHDAYSAGFAARPPAGTPDAELTEAEAQKAYDDAPAVPLSEERIREIVRYATGRPTL